MSPVVANENSEAPSAKLAGMRPAYGRTCLNADDLDRLFERIRDEKGKLDILFANAGIAKYVIDLIHAAAKAVQGSSARA